MEPAWRARAVSGANRPPEGVIPCQRHQVRPRKVDDPEDVATATRMEADGDTGKDIAKYLGVSRATLYRYLADHVAL
jgi:hypothetical protein